MKRKCPECGARFFPTVPWQEYDKPACRQKAFRRRRKGERDGRLRLHPKAG